MKTGNLGYGTYAFLFTASMDIEGMHLDVTGAIQGGATRESVNADVLRMIDSIRRGFHDVPVALAGDHIGTVTAPWGGTTEVVISRDVDSSPGPTHRFPWRSPWLTRRSSRRATSWVRSPGPPVLTRSALTSS